MGIITDTTKIDRAFKFTLGKGYTTTQKGVDNEDAPSGFIIGTSSIFSQDAGIPTTAPGASTSILNFYGAGTPARFKMVYDVSSPLNRAWYASTDGSSLTQMRATRVPNWVPPTFGNYTIRIFLTVGSSTSGSTLTEIFFSDATSPVFDYKTGILTFESDPLAAYASLAGGPPDGIQISGYVYTGPLLSQIFDANGNFTGGLSDFGTSTALASFVNPGKGFEVSSPFAISTAWNTETTPYGTSNISWIAASQHAGDGQGIVVGTSTGSGIIAYSFGHGVWRAATTIPGGISGLQAVWAGPSQVSFATDASNNVIKSTDAARNWVSLTPLAFSGNAIWGSSLADIFIVGPAGNIVHSTNGTTFSAQTNTDGYNLNAIWGSSSADIFAVGASGTIRHATGTGTWSGQTSGTTNNLFAVFGFSSTEIYAGGASGTLLKSTGGGTWASFNSGIPSTFSVNGIYGISSGGTKKLYVSGTDSVANNYAIYVSSGTNSWTLETSYSGSVTQVFSICGGITGLIGGLDSGRVAILHKNPVAIIHGHGKIDGYWNVGGIIIAKDAQFQTASFITSPSTPSITVNAQSTADYSLLSASSNDTGEGFRIWRESSSVYTLDVGSKVSTNADGVTPFAAGGRIRLGGFTTSPSTTARGEIETVTSSALAVKAYQGALNLTSTTANVVLTPGSGQIINANGNTQVSGVLNITGFTQCLNGLSVTNSMSVSGDSGITGNFTVSGYNAITNVSIGSHSVPTAAYTVGRVYRDNIPLAYGSIRNNAGTLSLLNGFNISSISHPSTGLVTITMGTAGISSTSTSYTVMLTIDYTNSSSGQIARYTRVSATSFTVDTHDVGLTGRDQDFSFVVFSI